MTEDEAAKALRDCRGCLNAGYTIESEDDPSEKYHDCEWGSALREKDDTGSWYTLRAFRLRKLMGLKT